MTSVLKWYHSIKEIFYTLKNISGYLELKNESCRKKITWKLLEKYRIFKIWAYLS